MSGVQNERKLALLNEYPNYRPVMRLNCEEFFVCILGMNALSNIWPIYNTDYTV